MSHVDFGSILRSLGSAQISRDAVGWVESLFCGLSSKGLLSPKSSQTLLCALVSLPGCLTLNLGLLDVFSWLDWGDVLLRRLAEAEVICPSWCITLEDRYVESAWITGDANLDHLVEVAFASIPCYKITTFPFVIIKYVGCFKNMQIFCYFGLTI